MYSHGSNSFYLSFSPKPPPSLPLFPFYPGRGRVRVTVRVESRVFVREIDIRTHPTQTVTGRVIRGQKEIFDLEFNVGTFSDESFLL